MVYEKSWSWSFNNEKNITTNLSFTQWQVWSLKNLLTGGSGLTSGIWSVYSSSDSVAAGNGDNVDRWTTTFDASKLVRSAVGANPKSWVTLKSPATMNGITWYLTISMQGTGDSVSPAFISKTAPTGGTVNVRPSSAVEWGLGAATGNWNQGETNTTIRTHICLCADGSFYFFTSQVGFGTAAQVLAVVAPVGCNAGDNFPLWTHMFRSRATSALTYTQLNQIGTSQPTLTSAGAAAGNSILEAAGNPYTSADAPDCLTGKYMTLPAHVMVNAIAGGTWHLRGRLPDVFITVPGAAGGADLPGGLMLTDLVGNITHFTTGGSIQLPGPSSPNFNL